MYPLPVSESMPSGTAERTAADSRYVVAGAVYFVLGCAIMAITVLTPGMASEQRRADLAHLLIGLPFFALFAVMIAYGDRLVAAALGAVRTDGDRASRIGSWVREKLTMLLTLSALGRTFVFAANGLGWKPGLDWPSLAISMEAAPPMPRMLVNALLMSVILVLLIRAAWVPFVRRLTG